MILDLRHLCSPSSPALQLETSQAVSAAEAEQAGGG